MAIPFNIPEGQNEVDVIINQLQTLLTKLQAAVRRSRGVNQQNPATAQVAGASRVRVDVPNRARSSNEDNASTSSTSSANVSDVLNNLAWLAASQDVVFNSSQLTANSVIRAPRRRTSSESSCCEETKISITTIVNQDWNQAEYSSNEHNRSGEGLLSKLVPSRVSAPLWTAMICFVGWHIFRAR